MLNDYFEQMIEAVFKNFKYGLMGDGPIPLFGVLRHEKFYEPIGETSVKAKAESAQASTINAVP
jgi:hypothetical protein